jgi:TonB family protein
MLASGLMHAGAIAFFWFAAADAVRLPEMRVYSVNIVSPPPQLEGEPTPPVPAPEEPAAAEEAPAPEPEPAAPEPEPTPPAPKPEPKPAPPAPKPAEPKPAPPKEQPKPKPEPAKEQPKPKPAPAKEQPKPAPAKPAEQKPAAPAAPTPSRGRNAQASSAGGEGLNVRIEGVEFADPAYLQNIIRQVQRYFRPPAGARADVAEVLFWIERDGSVGEIQLVNSSGSFAFRSAAMEAVEQAGLAKAFGPLPKGYPADRLPVAFEFKPAR